MKTKRFLWFIVAAAVFAATGYAAVRGAARIQDVTAETLSLFQQEEQSSFPAVPFLAQISVEGTIAADSASLGMPGGYSHEFTLDNIRQLAADPDNVGILLYINSPGGTINAADELYLELMDYKEQTGRPIYCYFGDTACSGGYYVAMAADQIWANRNSLCVNIGVYISTYNFAGLLEKLGVEQVVFRSSENKGIGLPGAEWTQEQRDIYQSIVDVYYQQFLEVVSAGRDMTPEEVQQRDDGREMVAVQALEAGFVDGIGRYGDYQAQVLEELGDTVILYTVSAPESSLINLLDLFSSHIPQSDSQVWQEFMDEHSGMVVMAYAGNG